MYFGANYKLFEFAKRMRYAPTEAEKVMWRILTSQEFISHKFRRQHPLAKYIADFFSHPLLLVIELDGGYHLKRAQMEVDVIRDEDMQELGMCVVRFTNEEILKRPEEAQNKLKTIIATLNQE